MKPDNTKHGLSMAGAGDVGDVLVGEELGPCPSCGVMLATTKAKDPRNGEVTNGLLHPVPFCSYFGETDVEDIVRDMARKVPG